MTMRVLILAAGPVGDGPPVLLAEQNGELLLERFVRLLQGLSAKLVFIVRAEDQKRFHIDSVIKLAAPGSSVVLVSGETGGAACTALLAIEHLDMEDELLILASNELLDIDYHATIEQFRKRQLDAATVVFPSLHPRYSYVAMNDEGYIVEAAEKRPISRLATAGFYWFRRGAEFVAAAQEMVRKDAQVDGRFYISLTLNQYVLWQKKLGVHEVESRQYQPLKSRHQISIYEGETHPEPVA
ncbi:MAG: glycosyltransferase family 2 protein [Acidocella sp.]|nr:glycosyltransferase family 2 protein [Acidocella sp.]